MGGGEAEEFGSFKGWEVADKGMDEDDGQLDKGIELLGWEEMGDETVRTGNRSDKVNKEVSISRLREFKVGCLFVGIGLYGVRKILLIKITWRAT